MVKGHKRLLLVDADETQFDSLRTILEKQGFCAVQCNSADEGERSVQRETFANAVLREGEDGLLQMLRNRSPRTLTHVTEHKNTMAEVALQARVRQQSIAADLGWLALRGIGFHEFAQTACERVAEGLGVELCKVLELLPGGDLLFLRAGVGWDEGLVGHATLGTHRSSQAGYTLDSDRPVVVEDLRSETRFEGPPLLTDHGVVSGVSVVIGGTKPYGVLGVHTRTKRVFTAEDISFLNVVANLLAEFVERKAAEQQLRQHLQTLTHVSRLSTMGEMLAGIIHEINQPLHAISNFATASIVSLRRLSEQVDEAGDLVRQVLEWNTEIRNASRRAGEILQRMRSFARKGGHPREAVNLNDLLHESIELAAVEARMAQVTVQTDLDESLPPLLCDRIQIEQVVVNLLLNAFEAFAETENRLRRVLVRSRVVDHHLAIQVVDNGPGIPQGGRDIFEAFFTTKPAGMGMGLAISKTIVESHGGRLNASNNDRCGATFQISFPLETGETQSAVDDLVRERLVSPQGDY